MNPAYPSDAVVDHPVEVESGCELLHLLGLRLGYWFHRHGEASSGFHYGYVIGADAFGDVYDLDLVETYERTDDRESQVLLLGPDVHEGLRGHLSERIAHDDPGGSDALGEFLGYVLHGPLAEHAGVVTVGVLDQDPLVGPVVGRIERELLAGDLLQLLGQTDGLLGDGRVPVLPQIHMEEHDVRTCLGHHVRCDRRIYSAGDQRYELHCRFPLLSFGIGPSAFRWGPFRPMDEASKDRI